MYQSQYRDLEPEVSEVKPKNPPPFNGMSPALSQELLMAIQSQVMAGTESAIKQAIATTQAMGMAHVQDAIARVKEELGAYKPKHRVLHVAVGDAPVVKLSDEAHPLLGRIILNVKLGEYTGLVGPAGCGKSKLSRQLGEALKKPVATLVGSAGLTEASVWGRHTASGPVPSAAWTAFKQGGIFNIGEFEKLDPNLFAGMHDMIDSDVPEVYNPILGETAKRHPDFYVIVDANTYGMGSDGKYTSNRMDFASLTRFNFLAVDYDSEIEEKIREAYDGSEVLLLVLQEARKKLRKLGAEYEISYRHIRRAFKFEKAGLPVADIYASVTSGWPSELIEQAGLVAPKESPKPKSKPKPVKPESLPDDAPKPESESEQYPF